MLNQIKKFKISLKMVNLDIKHAKPNKKIQNFLKIFYKYKTFYKTRIFI